MNQENTPNSAQNTLSEEQIKNIEVFKVVEKIKNYFNIHYNIDGRPPSKTDFNEFLDSLVDKN
jgi:coenzyme F420-reducing hydrogenase gamma subunit